MLFLKVFNKISSVTEPRGNATNFVPPLGGPATPERYTTRYFYDYQENECRQFWWGGCTSASMNIIIELRE